MIEYGVKVRTGGEWGMVLKSDGSMKSKNDAIKKLKDLAWPIAITMPCNIRYIFNSEKDLPMENYEDRCACACGNPDHKVVFWETVAP